MDLQQIILNSINFTNMQDTSSFLGKIMHGVEIKCGNRDLLNIRAVFCLGLVIYSHMEQ